jgi:TrmH family RNA methyltransferase
MPEKKPGLARFFYSRDASRGGPCQNAHDAHQTRLPMEIIRSRQNPLVKQLIKLSNNRRERLKQRQTLLFGAHLVESALAAGRSIARLLVCEGEESDPEIAAIMQRTLQQPIVLDRGLFSEIEQSPSTTGLMALFDLPPPPLPVNEGFCLLLEGVQDPGNVGSILRTATAAGVDQVWLTPGCADAWSPKVLRAGMGAHFLLPILERASAETVLSGFRGAIAATTLDQASSLYDTNLGGSLVIAFGNEGGGLSADLLARANLRVHIPMTRQVESLNVGAAVAICVFERRRQLLSQK